MAQFTGGYGYPGYYQNYTGSGYTYTQGMGGGGGTNIKHASAQTAEDDGDDNDSDGDDDDPASGGVVRLAGPPEGHLRVGQQPPLEETHSQADGMHTVSLLESRLADLAERHALALFHYAVSGDPCTLLALQRPLMTAQDEDGDTGLHLSVIHSQTDSVRSLTKVIAALPGEDVINMRNDLYQTPLHLAVITQQVEAAHVLLQAGADARLSDRHGNTALHLAAQQREGGDLVAQLLQHPLVAQLTDTPNSMGLCALHLAVLANSLSAVRALLAAGASVEAQEVGSGRTPLHLAVEQGNVSLSGCLLLEGNAEVDSCTYDGSTPLHMAAGRGSLKLCALLMAAGADPHKENFEPAYFREEEGGVQQQTTEDEEDDEGYIPGTTPMDLAASSEVREILSGKEYQPESEPIPVPTQGDMRSLGAGVKQALCAALEGGWESLAHSLGLGVLTTAFRLSPSPAGTLLDSYEVSGGTVHGLLESLREVGISRALDLLQHHQPVETTAPNTQPQITGLSEDLLALKLGGGGHDEGGVCDSGVETSFHRTSLSLELSEHP